MNASTTWDGLPAATEKPFGAAVVVWRKNQAGQIEFLLLHRAHRGEAYEGDWAWTPPSGCRFPGESIEACAKRELYEEAGLDLPLEVVEQENDGWVVFVAEAPPDAPVNLIDKEHDKYKWLPADFAIAHCEPAEIKREFQAAVDFMKRQV